MKATYAEIDLSAIAFNLQGIQKKVNPARIIAVVKANAYGHGVIEVTRIAINCGVNYLAVALVEEGIEIRENNISTPILVFGGEFESQLEHVIQYDLEISVFSERVAEVLSKIALKNNIFT